MNEPLAVTRTLISNTDGMLVWEVTNSITGEIVGHDVQAIEID